MTKFYDDGVTIIALCTIIIAAEIVDDDISDVTKFVNVVDTDDVNDDKDVCNVETELDNEAICKFVVLSDEE